MLRAKRVLAQNPLLLVFSGFILSTLIASVILAEPWQDATSAAQDEEKTAQDNNTGEADDTTSDEKSTEDDGEAKEPGFAAKLDGYFGDWVVTPVGKVLMFDFASGDTYKKDSAGKDLEDEDGNKIVDRKGWLGASVPLVVVWLSAFALFFTTRMMFINLRGFWHAIRLTKGDYDDPSEPGEVSHFQALASALSATVGLGNIAGVAIAIGTGGPGAVVWIIAAGLFGMTMKFTECSLGQMYRKTLPDGTVSGGPMHYLRDGLAAINLGGLGKVLATIFAVLCVFASIGGGNTFQVVQAKDALVGQVDWIDGNEWVFGLVMAVMVGIVIIGGIKRIGAAAGKIVPLMCGIYVAISLYIIIFNAAEIPRAFREIWDGAFNADAAFGGFIGVMVIGIRRAVFSNEAGVGSAAIAHSAAKTDEPISEGIVALLEPFIDTIIVCTMTALVIVITKATTLDGSADYIANNKGAALTALAWGSQVSWFPYVLMAAIVLFAYSTLISWSYYGERCSVQLFGPKASLPYRAIFVLSAFLGSMLSASNVLEFSDMLILAMAFPNLLGVGLMSGEVKRKLNDYWSRYKKGELEPEVKYGNKS